MNDEPFIRVDWIIANLDEIAQRIGEHLLMTIASVAIGFVVSFALAIAVRRRRRLYAGILGAAGVIYAIPSLALFVLLIPLTGLTPTTGIIALVGYTLLILVRNNVTALDGVAPDVVDAAIGIGYTRMQRFWRIELPLALPVMIAGLRIATVTTIGLVTVTTFIGLGGLGYLIVNAGIRRFFDTATYTGVVLSVALAVLADVLLLAAQHRLTPWARQRNS